MRHQGLKLMLDGCGLTPEAAADVGYVDEVVPADELLDRAVMLGDRLAERLKFTVAAVRRVAYICGSLSLEGSKPAASATALGLRGARPDK